VKKQHSSRIGGRAFDAGVYIICGIVALLCLYPIYLVVINSFSDPYAVARGEVFLVPKGFSLDAYVEAFKNGDIMRGYANSLFYLVVGVCINMLLTIPAAYVLSKQNMKGRNTIMMFIVFTMYFSGGLVPHYLMVRGLNLINTRTVILLEGAIVTTNLIIARTFFASSIPRELEEAAEIDGCSGPQVFFKIVLPLSKAMLGVILLYYAVGRWNNYTSSLYYQPTASELHSLQMVIKKMVLQMQSASDVDSEMAEYYANLFNQIKYSVIVITSLPLLVLYPFLQKYFEKGVMIGSVKG
jgi:putative aldouronate transport system permease protein